MKNSFFLLLFLTLNLFSNEDLANRLIIAYPSFLEKYEDNFIYFKDGSKMEFSKNREFKSYEDRLNNSSLED